MTALASLLLERPVLLDGGMGTQILARRPSADDFGGAAYEGCMELLNRRRPQWIREIHAAYLEAGADAVETNTFGANAIVLAEFGLEEQVEALNTEAARLAREVASSF
ncbi:MAG TPA: homocysteine S-methyltransferase family protein, partial [Holophaga sp.]|nr:homocysteine S-methyltransferase family protein [Holophaga sp.]